MPLIATDVDTGAVLASNVVVAATRATRAVGLMAREHLDPGAVDAPVAGRSGRL